MLTVLTSILCVLKNILLAVLWGGAKVLQLLVDVLVAALVAVFSILPGMPDMPDVPNPFNWIGAFNYFIPVGAILTAFTAILVGYLIYLTAVAIMRKAGVIGS